MWRVAVVLAVAVPSVAMACATCTCGNPALTSMGGELPFAGRLRLATSIRGWALAEGTPRVDELATRELRADLTVSWSPLDRLTVLFTVPFQARELTTVSLARERGFGMGEAELLLRGVVFSDRRFFPRAVVSVLGGIRLPSATPLVDARHQPLGIDAQLGPGWLVPTVGLGWSGFFTEKWSAFAIVQGEFPATGPAGFRPPVTGRLLAMGQFQPWSWLGLRLGGELRLEGPRWLSGEEDAAGSGAVVFLAPEVVLSPVTDLLLSVGMRVPVVTAVAGPAWLSPVVIASVVVDL